MIRQKPFHSPEFHQQRAMGWILLFALFGTTLIVALEAHDSALLKQPVLVIGTALLIAYYLWLSLKRQLLECPVTYVHVFFALYLFASYLSIIQATNAQRSISEAAFQFSYFTVFVFTFWVAGIEEGQRFLQNGILILAVAVTGVGLVEALSPSAFGLLDIDSERPVFATFGNATYFAGFIVMLAPVILSQIVLSTHSALKRSLLAALLLVMMYELILTQTRTSWVAVTVGIVLFIFLQFRSMKMRWLMVGALVGAIVVGVVLSPLVVQRRLAEVTHFTVPVTIKARFTFYDAAWKGILSSPLLGHGVGNTVVSIPLFRSPDYWMASAEDIVTHLHNECLEVLFETGIAGFLPWCALLVVYFAAMKKAVSSSGGPERTLLVGYVCATVGFLVDNLTSMNFRVPADALLFWVLVGLSLGHTQIATRTISLRLPSKLVFMRWIPAVGMIAFLYFYIPHIGKLYAADKYFNKGLQLNKSNNPLSEQLFQNAVTNNPDHEQARFFLSLNLVQEKSFHKARLHLDTLLSHYPAYPKARLLLALSLYDLGDTAQAFREAEKDLQLATYPQSYHYMCALAYRSHLSDLEYTYTILRLQKNIQARVNDYADEAVMRLGFLCQGKRRADTCRSLIMLGIQTFEDQPPFLLTAGEALVRLGDVAEAETVLATIKPELLKDSTLLGRYTALSAKMPSKSK